jgi:hypothetical protein
MEENALHNLSPILLNYANKCISSYLEASLLGGSQMYHHFLNMASFREMYFSVTRHKKKHRPIASTPDFDSALWFYFFPCDMTF